MSTANRRFTTVSFPNAETIALALGGRRSGDGWIAHCPAHEDHRPSLSLRKTHDGTVLFHCHAGCRQSEVLEALRQRGLWSAESAESAANRGSASCPPATASQPSPNRPAGRSAMALWASYPPAQDDHPYLTHKRIGAHDARFAANWGALVLPLLDTNGAVQGLQYIAADGKKKFSGGSKVTGHFFLIGETEPAAPCYIAEGFATAATIHETMGGQAVVAFNAGNLKPTAETLRQQWPDRPLVLCADDDAKTIGNPGLSAARKAARSVGGSIAVPDFGANRPANATDFNDLALSQGPQAVRDSIQQATGAFPTLDNLVAMAVENPGYPFQPEVTAELAALRVADPARYEALRSSLKKQTDCRVTQLDQMIRSVDREDGGDPGASNMANRLVSIAGEALGGWDAVYLSAYDHQAFADLVIADCRETWLVDSQYFRFWLTEQFNAATGDTPGSAAIEAAMNCILAKAQFSGRERPVFTRSGAAEDKLYLDLCDPEWRCVEISRDGWQVIDSADSPVRFRRHSAMDGLPVPVRGGSVAELRPYVNVASEEDFILLVAWLLGALRHRGPYPVLVVSGEPGSAKSTVVRLLRSLVDPSLIPMRVFPDRDEDIFLHGSHCHLLVYDNLSGLSHSASDLLCQLATGGGYGRRELFKNQEEFVLHISCPIVLNGIANVAVRSDLADRSVCLALEPVADADRRPESALWSEFERIRPRILGALLDAMIVGIRRLPDVRLPETPRMADFACWAAACETAYWPEGTFLAVYSENRQEAMGDVVDNDPVAEGIRLLVSAQSWEGTASQLLAELEPLVGERTAKSRRWPGSASVLARDLRRVAPALRRFGIEIVSFREGKGRMKMIQINNSSVLR